MREPLENAIRQKSATIGVIGIGCVGLPRVRAFVVDASKVERLKAGQSHIGHVPSERGDQCVRQARFTPTADMDRLAETLAQSVSSGREKICKA